MASKNQKTVFDVSKPGKAAAPATSKPVIVGNRSIIKDSIIAQPNQDDAESPELDKPTEILTTKVRGTKTIQPSEELKAEVGANDESESEEPEKSSESPPLEELAGDSAIVDELADRAASKKKSGTSPEEKAQSEKIQKLIEDKKYFVPISTPPAQRKGIIISTLVLVLIFGAAAFYVLLDAKIVKNNLKLPFEFFKELPPVQIELQPQPAQSPAVESKPAEVPKETDLWLEYKGTKLAFRVPDGWTLTEQTDSDVDVVFGDLLIYKKGTKAIIKETTGGRDGICCFIAVYDSKTRSASDFAQFEATAFQTDGGKTVNRYKQVVSEEPDGIGPAKGSTVYYYLIKGENGDGLYFSYEITAAATSVLDIVEKAIKTARIL
ncbi:MAG: hypothetical protein AAB459_00200 [Patescibacteria group bacterium]